MLCVYGCGKEAQFFAKNGEGRCSKGTSACPVIKAKQEAKADQRRALQDPNFYQKRAKRDLARKINSGEIPFPEGELCYYGCGFPAIRILDESGKFVCFVGSSAKCPALKRQQVATGLETKLEHYGTTDGNEIRARNDPEFRKILDAARTRQALENSIKEGMYVPPEGQLCEYGCNQLAKFALITADRIIKHCCAPHYQTCPAMGTWPEDARAAYKSKTGFDHPFQKTEEIRATRFKKHGVNHHMKVPEIMDRKKATCVELYGAPQGFTEEQHQVNVRAKYGVDNVFQLPEVIEKLKVTNMGKFGAEYPHASEEFREEFRKRYFAEFGFEHPLEKGAPGQIKQAQTNLTTYGFEHASQSEEVKEKGRQTCIEHWGVPNAHQNAQWFEANLHKMFKWKPYTLPSGREIKLQGYEPQVLDLLLKDHNESEFTFDNKPAFAYVDPITAKARVYHPDFVIGRHIIEVKSQYYFDLDYKILLRKGQACMEEGYEFTVAVSDEKGIDFQFIPYRNLIQ